MTQVFVPLLPWLPWLFTGGVPERPWGVRWGRPGGRPGGVQGASREVGLNFDSDTLAALRLWLLNAHIDTFQILFVPDRIVSLFAGDKISICQFSFSFWAEAGERVTVTNNKFQ